MRPVNWFSCVAGGDVANLLMAVKAEGFIYIWIESFWIESTLAVDTVLYKHNPKKIIHSKQQPLCANADKGKDFGG